MCLHTATHHAVKDCVCCVPFGLPHGCTARGPLWKGNHIALHDARPACLRRLREHMMQPAQLHALIYRYRYTVRMNRRGRHNCHAPSPHPTPTPPTHHHDHRRRHHNHGQVGRSELPLPVHSKSQLLTPRHGQPGRCRSVPSASYRLLPLEGSAAQNCRQRCGGGLTAQIGARRGSRCCSAPAGAAGREVGREHSGAQRACVVGGGGRRSGRGQHAGRLPRCLCAAHHHPFIAWQAVGKWQGPIFADSHPGPRRDKCPACPMQLNRPAPRTPAPACASAPPGLCPLAAGPAASAPGGRQ